MKLRRELGQVTYRYLQPHLTEIRELHTPEVVDTPKLSLIIKGKQISQSEADCELIVTVR